MGWVHPAAGFGHFFAQVGQVLIRYAVAIKQGLPCLGHLFGLGPEDVPTRFFDIQHPHLGTVRLDQPGQAVVVGVMVGDHQALEVAKAQAVFLQRSLEAAPGLGGIEGAVHQRGAVAGAWAG